MDCELDLHIDEPFRDAIDVVWLRRAVEKTLSAGGVDSKVELGVVVTDDRVLQELNRTYRGIDATTDVLAFVLPEEGFALPPDGTLHLGEVFISYPQAERQAKEQGHSLGRELALLVIHGVLHLLGHDHEDTENEEKMRTMEATILASIFGEAEQVRHATG